jgi:hypothetical protein
MKCNNHRTSPVLLFLCSQFKRHLYTGGKKINIIKVSHDFNTRRDASDVLRPSGLTAERQWYLYEQIRQHIPNEVDKNDTAPKPKCIRPKQNKI